MASAPPESICVLIPCLNEEHGIAGVVTDFRTAFPAARILVVDNGSTDRTSERASQAGAEVMTESRRGKGQAVVSALQQVREEVLILVDGDGSYPAEGAVRMLEAFRLRRADMVVGIRSAVEQEGVYRPFHQLGGAAFSGALSMVFAHSPRDLFSGLRLFSRRFYRNVPLLFRGFELETELTIQAIEKGFAIEEVDIPFTTRAAGSSSKLRTLRDGSRILRLVVVLFRDYRPMWFFGLIGTLFFLAGLASGWVPVLEYLRTGLVGHFPRAILAAGLMNLSLMTFLTGVTLESGLRHRREAYQIELRKDHW